VIHGINRGDDRRRLQLGRSAKFTALVRRKFASAAEN
jgi:hypothetical protein